MLAQLVLMTINYSMKISIAHKTVLLTVIDQKIWTLTQPHEHSQMKPSAPRILLCRTKCVANTCNNNDDCTRK